MAVEDLAAAEAGKNYIQHYGVKGMHWGQRKAQAKSLGRAGAGLAVKAYAPSKDAKAAAQYQTIAKLGGVKSLNNNEMRLVIQRMELEQRYRDLYGEHQLHDEGVAKAKRWAKKGARWASKFTEDVAKDAATSWVARPGSNVSREKDPVRVRAWTTGQEFAGALEKPRRRAIGS